jgi:hypothetical protein
MMSWLPAESKKTAAQSTQAPKAEVVNA